MLIWYDLILPYSWRTFWLAKYPPFPLRKPAQLLGKKHGENTLLERSWWKAPALAFSTPSGPLTAAARWLATQWDSQVRLVGLGHGIWPQMAKNWMGHRWWTGVTISWWWDKGDIEQKDSWCHQQKQNLGYWTWIFSVYCYLNTFMNPDGF